MTTFPGPFAAFPCVCTAFALSAFWRRPCLCLRSFSYFADLTFENIVTKGIRCVALGCNALSPWVAKCGAIGNGCSNRAKDGAFRNVALDLHPPQRTHGATWHDTQPTTHNTHTQHGLGTSCHHRPLCCNCGVLCCSRPHFKITAFVAAR